MSIIQNNNLRYIKRNNLEQEAKLIGNYYRDIINAYGVDCKYFKVDFELPDTIDTLPLSSTIYQSIYGSDASMMTYALSADMVSYMEVDDDLFMLNKYGVTPETEVTFFFDIKDFAAKFATQLGRYDEFAIDPINVVSTLNDNTLSGNVDFTSEIMSGMINLTNTIESSSGVVQCSVVSATIPKHNIPVNEYLAKYFTYDIEGGSAPVLSQFTYETSATSGGETIIYGEVTGSALYYNLEQISKYLNYIRPQVGDVIRIDFPGDDNEGEEYEITDTMDRNLTQDGINPLLHKYIWRCKALRRIPSYEDLADGNELNADQFIDVLKKKQYVEGVINDELESYEDSVDDVYGGYDSAYDNEPDIATVTNLEDMEHIDSAFIIMEFANGSLLYTDGYDLFFRNTKGSITKLTLYNETSPESLSIPIELDYMKATDHSIYFVNMEGDSWALFNTDEDGNAVESPGLTIMTASDSNINENGENFYKFANTRSIMYCNESDLYIRLGNADATTIKMTINP